MGEKRPATDGTAHCREGRAGAEDDAPNNSNGDAVRHRTAPPRRCLDPSCAISPTALPPRVSLTPPAPHAMHAIAMGTAVALHLARPKATPLDSLEHRTRCTHAHAP